MGPSRDDVFEIMRALENASDEGYSERKDLFALKDWSLGESLCVFLAFSPLFDCTQFCDIAKS